MSVKQNFPTIKPTLNLDFAGSKTVDSRITFTRASAATYTDAQGNIQTIQDNKPRIDYDPQTGECRGLLIEEQRTSLIPSASFITNGGVNVITQQYTTETLAPDGTFSATKITPTSNSVGAFYLDYGTSISAVNAGAYTYSVWVKGPVGYGTRIALLNSGGSNVEPFFSFTGVWQKISVTKTYTGSDSGTIRIHPFICRGAPGSAADTGLWPNYFYMWNPQLEVGTFATSSIITATTFTSRSSSATYIDSTGLMRTAGVNQPRYSYGYDSNTGKWVTQGLLLEPAATNLIIRSDVQANWGIPNAGYTYSTQTTAPDGSTIYSINKNSTYQLIRLGNIINTATISYPATYTFSFWAKTLSGTGTLTWDLGDSIVATGAAALTTTWQRFTYTFTATSASTFPSGGFIDLTMPDNSTYAIWGVQLETGSVATSTIPTFGATATRAADVSTSAATTRAVDSAVIKSNEFTKFNSPLAGTLYGEGTIISGTALGNGSPALAALSNSIDRDTHRFIVRRTNMAGDATSAGFNYRLATVINGISYSIDYSAAEGAQPEWEDAAVHKIIFGIDATSQQGYGDGVSAGITSISVPNFDKFDQVEIGQGGSSSSWNGHIRKVTYYNKRLSNTQLQALTA
jgi:hypothetical protein